MRQIEIGDINRAILQSLTLPTGDQEHLREQPAHRLVGPGLCLSLDPAAENCLISQLMGSLSYRGREPISRVINRNKRDGRIDLLELWAEMGRRYLVRRHTVFVNAEMFEQWRRDLHDLDEDLPGIALLALDDAGRKVDPDADCAYDLFQNWHTFATGDDKQLAQELAKGIACLHLHLGGSYPAPYFWVGLMNRRFSVDAILEQSSAERAFRYPQQLRPEIIRDHVQGAVALRFALFKFADALLENTIGERSPSLAQRISRLLEGERQETPAESPPGPRTPHHFAEGARSPSRFIRFQSVTRLIPSARAASARFPPACPSANAS